MKAREDIWLKHFNEFKQAINGNEPVNKSWFFNQKRAKTIGKLSKEREDILNSFHPQWYALSVRELCDYVKFKNISKDYVWLNSFVSKKNDLELQKFLLELNNLGITTPYFTVKALISEDNSQLYQQSKKAGFDLRKALLFALGFDEAITYTELNEYVMIYTPGYSTANMLDTYRIIFKNRGLCKELKSRKALQRHLDSICFTLSDRSKKIFIRKAQCKTGKDISKEFDISLSRCTYLFNDSLRKIRRQVIEICDIKDFIK